MSTTPEPAPLPTRELQACLEGSGRMLPAAAYTDPAVLAWEQRHTFEAGWVCIGRSDDLAAPGARRAFAVGSEGVLAVRGKDGVLRGFYNVCRHRGHELLPCGSSATSGGFIRCPYHAWVFDTAGDLYGVPPSHEADVTDKSQFSLVPVRLEEWHGFVFVNASGDAPPLAEYLGGLDRVVAEYDLAALRVGETHEYELTTNWKLIAENYHECFHCDTIHPELCVVSNPDSGTHVVGTGLWLGGTMWLRDGVETMSLDGVSRGVTIPSLTPGRLRDIVYIHVMPNLLISLHPDYVMTHRVEALAPDRTYVQCQWLFPATAWERPDFTASYAADFWDLTNRQDWTACESVQRGVASRGFRAGPLSTSTEYVVQSFVAMMARGYLAGGLPVPSAVDEVVRTS
jgi:glycine betaine catabolism A